MEKLIYVLRGAVHPMAGRVERIAESVVPAARAVGALQMAILVPDQAEEIRARCPARIGGDFASLAAVFECWLPALDAREAFEGVLARHGEALWGYLVTESTLAACPHRVAEGGRVPGVTQWGINDKPAGVALDDFFREWALHSKHSFELHPTRQSYIRNAVARRITPAAPAFLGIVLERFPRLEDFVDESIYFGGPEILKKVMAQVPRFYDFSTAITGGMSEYRFA